MCIVDYDFGDEMTWDHCMDSGDDQAAIEVDQGLRVLPNCTLSQMYNNGGGGGGTLAGLVTNCVGCVHHQKVCMCALLPIGLVCVCVCV